MNTQDKIAIMQAWVDGKDVEITHEDSIGWELLEKHPFNPYWDWKNCEYRIKPEPMEIQVWMENGKAVGVRKNTDIIPSYRYTLKTFVEKV